MKRMHRRVITGTAVGVAGGLGLALLNMSVGLGLSKEPNGTSDRAVRDRMVANALTLFVITPACIAAGAIAGAGISYVLATSGQIGNAAKSDEARRT